MPGPRVPPFFGDPALGAMHGSIWLLGLLVWIWSCEFVRVGLVRCSSGVRLAGSAQPVQVAVPVMAESSCRVCFRCRELTAARAGPRGEPGRRVGNDCLKRVARAPGPIKPHQSCRGGIPSGGEVAL